MGNHALTIHSRDGQRSIFMMPVVDESPEAYATRVRLALFKDWTAHAEPSDQEQTMFDLGYDTALSEIK